MVAIFRGQDMGMCDDDCWLQRYADCFNDGYGDDDFGFKYCMERKYN